jgi:hypothetical protein
MRTKLRHESLPVHGAGLYVDDTAARAYRGCDLIRYPWEFTVTELPLWLQQVLGWFFALVTWLVGLVYFLVLSLAPIALWFIFCLRAINWKRMAPTLKEGGWVPVVLLVVLIALVWSQAAPQVVVPFDGVHLPNFWWQLGAVALIGCVGLFAGWLQLHYSWTPAEIAIEPPAHAHEHHGHGHH